MSTGHGIKGYAPAIAGIWGREGGGVGEGLPKLKISYIILPFKTPGDGYSL
jgi:hypothetical protein